MIFRLFFTKCREKLGFEMLRNIKNVKKILVFEPSFSKVFIRRENLIESKVVRYVRL